MATYDFDGQVAFVTGAARGIGRSLAQKYAENGADVVAVDIGNTKETVEYEMGTNKQLEETARIVEDEGQDVLPVQADVSLETDVEAAVQEGIGHFGHIDILANNAGIGSYSELIELPETAWDEVIDTNLKGVWLCSKHVGKHFVERSDGGKIVSVSSIAGQRGVPEIGHYVAAKHGVIGLTKTLAVELATHSVNVNCVGPTFVETPMVESIVERNPEWVTKLRELSGVSNVFDPEGGTIEAVDVSEACLWLSSDAARNVTGVYLPVDAGALA